MRHLASTFGALAVAFTAAVPLHADPPARVARVSYIEGSVSLRPSSASDWVQASVNYPMTTGDDIWTDQSSRAELHVGSTAMQLGPQTALGFTNLDDTHFQARVDQGEVEIRVRAVYDHDVVELDTPNGVVTLAQPGQYRVDVTADGQTSIVTVRSGEADVATSSQSFAVGSGQSASITGTDNATYDVATAPAYDDLDAWSQARDRREDDAASRQYVSTEMTGYEDLDAYGTWRSTPLYGEVWAPAGVRPGWAPYRYGHWAFVQPWGWTWIDDAPWGFAPFHYGRWAYYGGQWVWVPGAVIARPVYAPALVAFVGGPHFSVSLRFGGDGGVAWFPLAPGEAYVPSYRVSDRYARDVNITNVHVTNINVTNINVTNIRYANERVAGGVTAVSRRTFESAQPIARVAMVVPPREALTGTVVGHTARVAPTPASRLGRTPGDARLTVRPPAAAFTRRVITRTAEPRATAQAPVTKAPVTRAPVTRAPVTKAPVGAIRPEPARVPVTVTTPATPSTDAHNLRAAPVTMQPPLRRAAPVAAQPVRPEPAVSRPGIAAVIPRSPVNAAPARVVRPEPSPGAHALKPAPMPGARVIRPPTPNEQVVRPEPAPSARVAPLEPAPSARGVRPEPTTNARVMVPSRGAAHVQPQQAQPREARPAVQSRQVQSRQVQSRQVQSRQVQPREVQPREVQPREVQPREVQPRDRGSTTKQDHGKGTGRRVADQPS